MKLIDLGQIGYLEAWECQKSACDELLDHGGPENLMLLEHPPVLTLGASFHQQNLLLTPEHYEDRGIEVIRTDRGGDVTYHGPGQLVIYPIFDVSRHGKDLHRWMRDLEEVVIRVCAGFGLEAGRFPPNTGVWIERRKVAAIGVKVKRWVSLHGIAINCDNDLAPFQLIVPCGIVGYPVTSLSQELGRKITVEEVKPMVVQAFSSVFGVEAAS